MLSRTHGQPASPTSMGKELMIFCLRFNDHYITLKNIYFKTKFSGAVGNETALYTRIENCPCNGEVMLLFLAGELFLV